MSERQRMLKNVEETAEAMRVLNMLTDPILEEIHRREAELCDEKALERCGSEDFKVPDHPSRFCLTSPLKLTEPTKGTMKRNLEGGSGALPISPGFCKRKSIWSPIKHAKVADQVSVLSSEHTPQWTPLRKSKARQSLSCNLENFKSPINNDALRVSSPSSAYTVNSDIEPRTPLKLMVESYPNQSSTKISAIDELGTLLPQKCDESCIQQEKFPVDSASLSTPTSSEKTDGERNTTVAEDSADTITVKQDCYDSEKLTANQSIEESCLEDNRFSKTPVSHLKSVRSPVRCSPILLQAYGEEVANVRGSIGSPDKLVNPNECPSSVDPSKVLKGVTAYVEVRRGEDDRTGGFRWKLKQLGATVSDTLNKKVTHVVFQEGLLSTFRKAKQLNVSLVSAQWVMACDESFTRVSETNFPIEKLDQYELADPLTKYIRRPKVMSPDLGSGRDDKRLSRRFQRIHRKSMQIQPPLLKTKNEPVQEEIDCTPLRLSSEESSNKSSEVVEDDESDDDGFLAMLEAQVREKATSRLKKEEAEKTVNEFKAQLQALLSQNHGTDDKKESSSVPLAKIFQPCSKVSPAPPRSCQKKAGKKIPAKPIAPGSFMKNWLSHKKTSFNCLESGNGKEGKLNAEAAADALSDEFLQSMITAPASESTPSSKDHVPSRSSSRAKPKSSASHSKTHAQESLSSVSIISPSTSSQSVTKRSTRNKWNAPESKASAFLMQSWLSKANSPPSTSPQKMCKSPMKNLLFDMCENLNELQGNSQEDAANVGGASEAMTVSTSASIAQKRSRSNSSRLVASGSKVQKRQTTSDRKMTPSQKQKPKCDSRTLKKTLKKSGKKESEAK